jgi:hypothetical protein
MVYFFKIYGGKMRFLIVGLLFFCILVPTWAKSQKATASLVIGEVEYQKKGKGKWRNLKVGSKIRNKDNVRTFAASRLEILFETGTLLHIEENSVISMKELLQNGANKSTKVKIGQGKILFNIKKLSGSLSKFEFETTTATAAIRGTAGGIGKKGNQIFAYLDKGKIELRSKGSNRKFFIESRDFAVQKGKNFEIKKLPKGVNLEKVLKKVIKFKKVNTIDSLLLNIPQSLMLQVNEVPGALKIMDSTKILDSTKVEIISDSMLYLETDSSVLQSLDSFTIADSLLAPGSYVIDTIPLDSLGNVIDTNIFIDSSNNIQADSLPTAAGSKPDTALTLDLLGNVSDSNVTSDSSVISNDSLALAGDSLILDSNAIIDSTLANSNEDTGSLSNLDLKWSLPQVGAIVTVPFYLTGSASVGSRILFNGSFTEVDASGYWKIIVDSMDEGAKEISIEVQNGDLTQSYSRNIEVSSNQIELSGNIDSYPKILTTTELDVSGTCIGGEKVNVGNFEAEVVSSNWKTTIYWNEAELGNKYYAVECFAGEKEVSLGGVSFDYEIPQTPLDLKLSTPASFKISDGMFKVAGKYKGTNAELKLQLGAKELNLSTPTGDFLYTAPISDKANSWGFSEALLVLSNDESEISKTIDFEVDKTSKTVNTITPLLNAVIDPLNGLIRLNVSSMKDDVAEITISTQDEELDVIEFENDLRNKTIKMLAGVNSYFVKVIDQAGNLAERRFKDVGYWNRVEFRVELTSRLSSGKIKLPPLPPGSDDVVEEYFTVRIRNLPDDDFRFIERIVIENTAVSFRRVFKQKQIDDVEYEIEIPLSLKKTNQLKIRVEPKIGLPVETIKYFQFVR